MSWWYQPVALDLFAPPAVDDFSHSPETNRRVAPVIIAGRIRAAVGGFLLAASLAEGALREDFPPPPPPDDRAEAFSNLAPPQATWRRQPPRRPSGYDGNLLYQQAFPPDADPQTSRTIPRHTWRRDPLPRASSFDGNLLFEQAVVAATDVPELGSNRRVSPPKATLRASRSDGDFLFQPAAAAPDVMGTVGTNLAPPRATWRRDPPRKFSGFEGDLLTPVAAPPAPTFTGYERPTHGYRYLPNRLGPY